MTSPEYHETNSGLIEIEVTTSFLVTPEQARSPEWQTKASEAFKSLGATMAVGSDVEVSFNIESDAPENEPYQEAHRPLRELFEEHADKSRPGWRQSVGIAVDLLQSRRITTPAKLIALGRNKAFGHMRNQKKAIERTNNLMQAIGLSDALKDEPAMEDIVPFCGLSDVLVRAVPGGEHSRVSSHTVTEILSKSEMELSHYLTSGKTRHTPEARSLYRALTLYAEEFSRQKALYKEAASTETTES
jgi:hypothetical protein